MNSPATGLRVAGTLFGLGCLGQLLRLLLKLEIVVAGRHIPFWLSGVAVVLGGLLCFWLWMLSTQVKSVGPGGPTPA